MITVTFAEARAKLSEFVRRAEAGETIEITRNGKPAARLVPPERKFKKIDVDALKRLTARMPMAAQSAADLVREMRDSDRY